MTERAHSVRNGLICVAVFTACFWLAWPVANMGFVDDWSYIKTAQVFAQTGHFVYNGWGAPILGWQVVWGALFIHLFGFSFMAVKLSTLPLAMATIYLFHAILVRFGSTPRNAIIGSLTLGLSPLFLPLAASFMTDISSLFVIVLCLYCCQRAVAAQGNAATIAWLSLAAASNVVGGTARQVAWLGALVMVPATAWFLRKRRGVLLAGSLLWAGAMAAVACSMVWYHRQPYSQPDMLSAPGPLLHALHIGVIFMGGEMFVLALMVYPVLAPWLADLRRAHIAWKIAVGAGVVAWTMYQWKTDWTLPWNGFMLWTEFLKARDPDATSLQFILPTAGCLLVSALVAATLGGFVAGVAARVCTFNFVAAPAFWLLAPFSFVYLLLLFPRAAQYMAYDRYMLCMMPIAIICLVLLHQQRPAPCFSVASILALVMLAYLAIAATHDWFACERARLDAIDELLAAGVPRNQISGGFEYDGWTQVMDGGHVNNPRVEIPAGAYVEDPPSEKFSGACDYAFAFYTPAVMPKYAAVSEPGACYVPTQFPSVSFRAWLPPFHGTVNVDAVRLP